MNDHRCIYHYRPIWTDYRLKKDVMVSDKVKIRECFVCGTFGQVSRLPVARRSYCPQKVGEDSLVEAEDKDLMLLILRLLYQKKNSVGYRVLIKNITSRGIPFQRVEGAVEWLHRYGWLVRQEKRIGTSRWEVYKIEIIPEHWAEVGEILGLTTYDWSELLEKLSTLPQEKDPNPIAERLRLMLIDQHAQLKLGTAALIREGKSIASTQRQDKYRLFIETLLEIYSVSSALGRIPLRNLAQRVCGDTKGLVPYKRELEFLLGAELREAGVFAHSDLCFVSGTFTYEIMGTSGNGKSSFPYLVLTEETVADMVITGASKASLLIVENLTLFEELLRRGYYQRPDIVLIFSGGYISTLQMQLLQKLLAFGNITQAYVWADPDPYGISIYKDIQKRLESTGIPVNPLMMDIISYNRLSVNMSLEAADLDLLRTPVPVDLPNDLQELWSYFSETQKKGEQEGFLAILTDQELLNLIP